MFNKRAGSIARFWILRPVILSLLYNREWAKYQIVAGILIRPRPHVAGYFWKRRFFAPYFKKPASTRSVLESYLTVHTWPGIFENGEQTKKKVSVLENTQLHVHGQLYDSKTLRLDTDFFKYGWKNLRFPKYPATCGRGLRNHWFHSFFYWLKRITHELRQYKRSQLGQPLVYRQNI